MENGFDSKIRGLAGRIIVLTRDPGQSAPWAEALAALGARPVIIPMVRFEPPADFTGLDRAIRDFSRMKWIIFPSANAVRFFLNRFIQLGYHPRDFAGHRIAAVGPATASVLASAGIPVDLIPAEATASCLAGELMELNPPAAGDVLVPRAEPGGEEWIETLRAAGWPVHCVTAYRTLPAVLDSVSQAELERAHGIIFASPSAVNFFQTAAGEDFFRRHSRLAVFSIGPTTSGALRKAGVTGFREAEPPGFPGILQALAGVFGPGGRC